jgi:type II secretory pathway predicted ATPase ExeA
MSLLYLRHFTLSKSPFQITPDIDFFFSGSQRGGILNALIHVACHEEGIATAVAEVGSGKTLLARLMISRLPDNVCTVYLANPCFSRDEIISAIARDLGLSDLPASMEGKLALLHQELLRRHAQGQRVLLVIDEAHLMPIESIEEVRLLSNLETGQHKLINIMLFGQPELDLLLADQRLRQVRDRVIHRFELPPMTLDEATSYIDHRLRIAGWQGGRLFSVAAINLLLKFSEGRARRINLLADKSLLAAYADGSRIVHKKHVRNASYELQPKSLQPMLGNPLWRQSALIGVVLAVIMSMGFILLNKAGRPLFDLALLSGNVIADHPKIDTPEMQAAPPQASPIRKIGDEKNIAASALFCPVKVNPATLAKKSYSSHVNDITSSTELMLTKKNMRGLTVRLASVPSQECLPTYVDHVENKMKPGSIFVVRSIFRDMDISTVYYGQYSSEQEARDALNSLRATVPTINPIIRRWRRISQEFQS